MKKSLGKLIAEMRKQKGMTQLELAEKMGVTDKGRLQMGAGSCLPGYPYAACPGGGVGAFRG